MNSIYDPGCRRCTRLAAFLDSVRHEQPGYFCRPVPPFGDPKAPLLIIGLAPGCTARIAPGRPFTGDFAGILLYETLPQIRLGGLHALIDQHRRWASRSPAPASRTGSNACRRQNKPLPLEVRQCNAGTCQAELAQSPEARVILALGAIAAPMPCCALTVCAAANSSSRTSRSGVLAEEDGCCSIYYHCSRYNTQTRRLTWAILSRPSSSGPSRSSMGRGALPIDDARVCQFAIGVPHAR